MGKSWMEQTPGDVQMDKDHHLGHVFRDSMLKDPDAICQIDAATGEEETRRSVLHRSTTLAMCLRDLGYKPGDVLALGGDNHLDLHIPFYAALMNGYPISGVDPFFKFDEIKQLFKQVEPKIAFCQKSSYDTYKKAVDELGFDTRIYTFGGNDNTMAELMKHKQLTEQDVKEFQIADIDQEKVYAFLISTSGSTGHPKVAAVKHQPAISVVRVVSARASPTLKPALNLSAVQWVSSFFNAVCLACQNVIKVQTSAPCTVEHVIDIINKYRPIMMISTPSIMCQVLQSKKHCDLSSFDALILSGAAIHKNIFVDLKAALRQDAMLIEAYGQTETLGPVLQPAPNGPFGNCGFETPLYKIRLVDPVTGETITEPNVPGELWVKGPIFTEYYNNPEETAKAITEDGWYKSGDLLRRDENGYFFFVERLKIVVKFRSYHVVPMELEDVIQRHEGVQEVCVTSIAHPVDGEWPVAVVVRSRNASVSEQEIKDLIADKLSEHKQLRGGVLFVEKMPMTSTGKIARAKVKQFVKDAGLLSK